MNKQSTWKKNLHKRKGQKGKDKSAKLMQLSPEQRKERYKKEKLDKIESKEKQSLESKAYAYTSSFKTKQSFGAANEGRSLSKEEIKEYIASLEEK